MQTQKYSIASIIFTASIAVKVGNDNRKNIIETLSKIVYSLSYIHLEGQFVMSKEF